MKATKFLKIFNSPFVKPRIQLYVGKTQIGTPYFLPRKLVKPTHEMAIEAAMQEIKEAEDWNSRNPNSDWKKSIKPLDEVYEKMLRHRFSIPKRIGFDFVGLGYKTKWSDTDYRFEWCPIWSFVFWKWQIALTFTGPDSRSTSNYWESWVYYYCNTKGTTRERVAKLIEQFPQTYIISTGNSKSTIDYYTIILKKRWQILK